tara:strand:+ start:331 stop:474 length:144 start_codon:yes stop_codon:yes gene_type:complete
MVHPHKTGKIRIGVVALLMPEFKRQIVIAVKDIEIQNIQAESRTRWV